MKLQTDLKVRDLLPDSPAGKLAIQQIVQQMESMEAFLRTASPEEIRAVRAALESVSFH